MKLTKQSMFTGKTHTIDIPLTEKEFKVCNKKWKSGTLIQKAFPMLDTDSREFIMTGCTKEEWDQLFGEE